VDFHASTRALPCGERVLAEIWTLRGRSHDRNPTLGSLTMDPAKPVVRDMGVVLAQIGLPVVFPEIHGS